MIERVTQYLQRLEPRERRMVVFGAVAALLLLIIAIVLPLQRSVSAVQQRVERKRDDLQWLRSMAPQLAGLQGSVPPVLRGPCAESSVAAEAEDPVSSCCIADSSWSEGLMEIEFRCGTWTANQIALDVRHAGQS